jgi:hypothetical protein
MRGSGEGRNAYNSSRSNTQSGGGGRPISRSSIQVVDWGAVGGNEQGGDWSASPVGGGKFKNRHVYSYSGVWMNGSFIMIDWSSWSTFDSVQILIESERKRAAFMDDFYNEDEAAPPADARRGSRSGSVAPVFEKVAFYEDPGILMIVQSVQDDDEDEEDNFASAAKGRGGGGGNCDLMLLQHNMCSIRSLWERITLSL